VVCKANLIDHGDGNGGWYTCDQYGAVRRVLAWLITEGQNHLPLGYSPIGSVAEAIGLRGVARMACGPESTVTIDDVHEQGFPAPSQRVTLSTAAPACLGLAVPLPTCTEDLVFTPYEGVQAISAAPLDVLVDVPAAGVGAGLNGKWVTVAGAVSVLPASSPCAAAGGLPACNVVLVDNIPVGYVSGALANAVAVPGSAGGITGQVIDNLVVVHSFA
jgi:hypothetical protein